MVNKFLEGVKQCRREYICPRLHLALSCQHRTLSGMYDTEALKIFAREPVSKEMVAFLVSTTNSVIQVKTAPLAGAVRAVCVPLTTFIENLISYSNVQTPTLMASLIYLNKLRNLLPANAVGMETTRHRIFLAALILSAKSLNDLSPLNKHWTKYTDGLLLLQEVNMAERELIGLLKWNISVKREDLVIVLQPFLAAIETELAAKRDHEALQMTDCYRLSNASRLKLSLLLASLGLSALLASSRMSMASSGSLSYSLAAAAKSPAKAHRAPLAVRSLNSFNRPAQAPKSRYIDARDPHTARVLA